MPRLDGPSPANVAADLSAARIDRIQWDAAFAIHPCRETVPLPGRESVSDPRPSTRAPKTRMAPWRIRHTAPDVRTYSRPAPHPRAGYPRGSPSNSSSAHRPHPPRPATPRAQPPRPPPRLLLAVSAHPRTPARPRHRLRRLLLTRKQHAVLTHAEHCTA